MSRSARTLTLPIVVAGSLAAGLNIAVPGDAHAATLPLRSDGPKRAHGSGWTPSAAPSVAPAAVPPPAEYTVVTGDTVSAIATRYGIPTATVLALNGLSWSSLIFPGQVIRLVSPTTPPAAPPAAAPPTTHTVAAGETVSGIASCYGLTTDAVLAANGLSRDSIIYPGQVLVLTAVAAPVAVERVSAPAPGAGLSAEMAENATTIIRTGRSIGVSDQAIVIALAAAMQESSLRNLDHGHLDSLGLFQQRPSQGWGTAAQILDPVRSTLVFFGGATNPNAGSTRGLLDIDGWETMTVAQAAQAVQISAYPDAYAAWEAPARQWLAQLG